MQQNINKIPKEKKAYIMEQDEEDSFFFTECKASPTLYPEK